MFGCSYNKPQRITPPDVLLQDCIKPAFNGSTYRDLIAHAIELGAALDVCNADKAALRQWAKEGESK